VDGTGREAVGEPDAGSLVDLCDERRALGAVRRVEGQRRSAQQCSERLDGRGTARWTLVDRRFSHRNRLGVRAAPTVTAARALRLRQQGVDLVHGGHVCRWPSGRSQVIFIPGAAPESGASRYRPGPSPLAASTMPSETPNFILRGARLAIITVRRPFSAAGSEAPLIPANTVRRSEP